MDRFALESPRPPRRAYAVTCDCGNVLRGEREEDGVDVEQWPCQGSDTCEARMCDCCIRHCEACGLAACPEHLFSYSGDLVCSICLAAMLAEVESVLAELKETA